VKYNELAIKVNIIRNCEINYNLSNISTMCYFDWSVVMEKKNEMSIDYRQDDKNSRKKMTFTHMTKRDKDRLGK
jgi:hypothetical protein